MATNAQNVGEDEKSLINARGTAKSKLTRYANQIIKFDVEMDGALAILEGTNRRFEQAYADYEEQHRKLLNVTAAEMIAGRDQEFDEANEKYDTACRIMDKLLCHLRVRANPGGISAVASTPNSPSSTAVGAHGLDVKLPRVKLPEFSGNIEAWPKFASEFKSIVHDNALLTDQAKFVQLRSAIVGKAAEKIETLSIDSANYAIAWRILEQHYDDPSERINSHIRSLINVPSVNRHNAKELEDMIDEVERHTNALVATGQSYGELVVTYLIMSKLDHQTRLLWQERRRDLENATPQDLIRFVHRRHRDLASTCPPTRQEERTHSSRPTVKPERTRAYNAAVTPPTDSKQRVSKHTITCSICSGTHYTHTCNRLINAYPDERRQMILKASLCLNCLRPHHEAKNCKSPQTCRKCNNKHHTLVHSESNPVGHATQCNIAVRNMQIPRSTLLSTASMRVADRDGQWHTCRVLLDQGAQSHFMSMRLLKRLRLSVEESNISVGGVGECHVDSPGRTTTTIQSHNGDFMAEVIFILLPRITGFVPPKGTRLNDIVVPPGIELADPKFNVPAEIDAIIGVGLFFRLLNRRQLSLADESILLQDTKLGWIVTSTDDASRILKTPNDNACDAIENEVAKFWQIESTPDSTALSLEEAATEEHFINNTIRDAQSGRYTVRLPIRVDAGTLGDSYHIARRRWLRTERTLAAKPDFRRQYNAFLNEYRELGHMTEINDAKGTFGYYLPHHAVIKTSSATTKLRVVFDGSAKTDSGLSLNDILMVGPTIQDDLTTLLIRFRSHRYVITADIEKMYRQVMVDTRDRHYQRILWRESTDQPIKAFELNTITYGTSSASFLATRTLQKLADDEAQRYPRASKAVRQDFYVDDLLTGAATLEETRQLRDELIDLTRRAGFNLRQWAASDASLTSDLTGPAGNAIVELDRSTQRRTLGILWDTQHDTIGYRVEACEKPRPLTKRNILSEIARLFDPLGLLGPVLLTGKLIMQSLWQLQAGWDEVVPVHLANEWIRYRDELPSLARVSFSRFVLRNNARVELHGFCDASEKGYGACIYARNRDDNGTVAVELITSKSRVAPLKTLSLPRLELCAAVLLTRLLKATIKALRGKTISNTICWSDSTVALHWIRTAPGNLRTFVGHRVAEIQGDSARVQWRHVGSGDNPADMVSRGIMPSEIAGNSLWSSGPTWLRDNESHWPINHLPDIRLPECKTAALLSLPSEQCELFHKYSCIGRMTRIVAYCLRFRYYNRATVAYEAQLSIQEIDSARTRMIRLAQRESFAKVIRAIEADKHAPNRLSGLDPFLDGEGVLRVGGRLNLADIPYSSKHPALLAKDHPLTALIIRDNHARTGHGGAQATLNAVRHEYWIVDGRSIVKRCIRQCVTCRRAAPSTFNYKMSALPANRISKARPFLRTGVDYAGPFYIKERRNRNRGRLKVYIAVFVCFVTRAAHLELVSDMTTEAFLAAFKRFTARRGLPTDVYSDNATNFVGADTELRSILRSREHQQKVTRHCINHKIRWHFIPPRSPHFGGIWEAAVKACKRHLTRIMGATLLTYEGLNTLIACIEGMLNSRPLTPLSSDPNDLLALTPGHFLIGDSILAVPEHNFHDSPDNRLSSWQHVQKMRQHFWQRWSREYLHEQTTRRKWHQDSGADIKVGALVVIHDDNSPPMGWKMGRVTELHPGADSVIRVVTVKTAQGEFKRCIKKLSPLLAEEL